MSKKKINKKLAQIFFFGFLVLFFGMIFYMPKTIPMVFPAAIIGGTAYSQDDLAAGIAELPQKSGSWLGGKKLGYSFLEPIPGVVSNDTPGKYLQGMIKVVIGITTALAVLMITIAGIEHIAGAGNESKRTAAKEKMWGALLGLILAVTSYLILNTINPDLLKLDLNTKSSVSTGGSSVSTGGGGYSTGDTNSPSPACLKACIAILINQGQWAPQLAREACKKECSIK